MSVETRKEMIGHLLFGVQIIGAALFCGAQFVRALVDLRGVSIVQFGLVATYLIFHLALAVGARRVKKSWPNFEAMATYCIWFVLMIAIIGAVLANGSYRWSVQDTTTLLIALVLTLLIVVVCRWYNLKIANPEMKALLAIAYKSVPQVLLAWKILEEGGSGIPALTVVVGHLTILIRLGQIYLMSRDPNRKWLAISETANEVSWVIATIAWLR